MRNKHRFEFGVPVIGLVRVGMRDGSSSKAAARCELCHSS